MQRDEARKIITAQFYQSLAEADVEVTSIPQHQLQAIVNAISDSVFAFVDALEEADSTRMYTPPPANAEISATTDVATKHVEEVLWQGRPFLTIGLRYELTSERLRIISGVLGKSIEEIELVRMRDSVVSQNVGERMLNMGDVTIFSNDPSAPEVKLENIADPIATRELLRTAMLAEKERRGMSFREEM